MTIIDQIKESVTILDVIQEYTNIDLSKVNIRRRGFNIKCPFHNDSNPSFTVWRDTNLFRCWAGCGRGDVIDLAMLLLNVDKKYVIHRLKKDFEINNESGKGSQGNKRRQIKRQLSLVNKEFNEKTLAGIRQLNSLDSIIDRKISAIKSIEDLELIGELYHIKPLINYWLDCLIHEETAIRFYTLRDVNKFIRRTMQYADR